MYYSPMIVDVRPPATKFEAWKEAFILILAFLIYQIIGVGGFAIGCSNLVSGEDALISVIMITICLFFTIGWPIAMWTSVQEEITNAWNWDKNH